MEFGGFISWLNPQWGRVPCIWIMAKSHCWRNRNQGAETEDRINSFSRTEVQAHHLVPDSPGSLLQCGFPGGPRGTRGSQRGLGILESCSPPCRTPGRVSFAPSAPRATDLSPTLTAVTACGPFCWLGSPAPSVPDDARVSFHLAATTSQPSS